MEYLNISHKRIFAGTIHSFSSELQEDTSVKNILKDSGYWSSKKRDKSETEYFIIDYHRNIIIDYIELMPSLNGASTFPREFHFESSIDGNIWKVIHWERKFELDGQSYVIDLPFIELRFLKVVITDSRENNSNYYSEIGNFNTGISGIKSISASSSFSEKSEPANLIDSSKDTYWQSISKGNSRKESLSIDLGKVFHVNRFVLGASNKGFPKNFYVEKSIDNDIWTTVFDEKNFKGEALTDYYWDVNITPARYIRVESRGVEIDPGQYGVIFSKIEISAAPHDFLHTHNIGELTPYSSVFQSGIVKLSKDGENLSGTVVQASDMRLRDATTIFKGIVQLAEDSDSKDGMVIQASDSRLKYASEQKPGIVRLAYDREIKSGTVVQGNDSRLQNASDEKFGIVKLCPSGLYTENAVVTGNDIRLHRATTESYGICRLADNGDNSSGLVVQANDKRLLDSTVTSKGIVELAEDGEDKEEVVVQGNDKRLKDATTVSKGIVELAEDGEEKERVAVQGNDRRLKDATIKTKGIVELASDGEDKPGVVVQGNDKRLKDATEGTKGILRFAKNGEDTVFSAVQGSDRRLKDATTVSKGIVELAEDGEDSEGVVVQGNDRRLKDATEEIKGILRFAENGEDASFSAVQGSDRRLKDATTVSKGIVELAEDGEDKEDVAVQGNDRRLKDATTVSNGIVELAEDGEDRPGVVVQGNDRRLKNANESNYGIVRFAKSNEEREGLVVQANDKRLSNKRHPLPHKHEYASINHDFNSHEGTISIKGKKSEIFKNIIPPSDSSSIIHGVNDSKSSGTIGVAGIGNISEEKDIQSYGVVGHSRYVGVRGQSSGGEEVKGSGVLGVSRFGAGGVFSSEHSHSLVADGYGNLSEFDDSINLMGNGDALLVKGKSEFDGQILINNKKDDNIFPANIAELFEVDEAEFLSPGDLLVIGNEGESILTRSRNEYSRGVIGVISGNPTVVLDNSGKDKKVYPVALAGKAFCKIDARKNPVNPGDLIVTSSTPGCGMVGKIDSFDKIGTVIGKALNKLEDGIEVIPIFITHK
ncbi:discoidin domain-containing protein [Spirochaetota bacterium]